MKYIIHLSDLHIGNNNTTERFTSLVEFLIYEFNEKRNYIIIITGDIVEDPNINNSYETAQALLKQLKQAGYTVLCCPGNHDYGNGKSGNKKFVRKFKQFFLNSAQTNYPTVNEFSTDDKSQVFIGLDTMSEDEYWTDDFGFKGSLGKEQLTKLSNILAQESVITADNVIIYMHHHPFGEDNKYTLADAENLKEVIQNSPRQIDILLFGHKHEGKAWHGNWGIPQIYDAGSSTFCNGANGVVRVVDLSEKDDSYGKKQVHTNGHEKHYKSCINKQSETKRFNHYYNQYRLSLN